MEEATELANPRARLPSPRDRSARIRNARERPQSGTCFGPKRRSAWCSSGARSDRRIALAIWGVPKLPRRSRCYSSGRGGTRTHYPRLRRPVLYPDELRARTEEEFIARSQGVRKDRDVGRRWSQRSHPCERIACARRRLRHWHASPPQVSMPGQAWPVAQDSTGANSRVPVNSKTSPVSVRLVGS